VKDIHVAGLVTSAVWLEHSASLEVIAIGGSADSREDCGFEVAGTHLVFRISLRGGWIWVYATGLDEPAPKFLFNVGDGPEGWTSLGRFLAAAERSGIESLHTRVQLGEPGSPDCFVIG
jgi:hypothetical protein